MRKWEPWKTNITKSNNHRMLQQLAFHKRQTIKATRVQDLDPRPCADNAHESVLAHEMAAIEPTEIPSRTIAWTPLAYLSHIKRRSNDYRFLASQWEAIICYSLFVTTPDLMDRLSNENATRLPMTLLGIICRLAKQSQRLLRFTTGSSTNWGRFLVQWDIGLKSTKLHLQRARNEVI